MINPVRKDAQMKEVLNEFGHILLNSIPAGLIEDGRSPLLLPAVLRRKPVKSSLSL